jgi:hypothetical protein
MGSITGESGVHLLSDMVLEISLLASGFQSSSSQEDKVAWGMVFCFYFPIGLNDVVPN